MKDERIHLRISTEDKEKLQQNAKLNGLSVSAYINMLIANNINKTTTVVQEQQQSTTTSHQEGRGVGIVKLESVSSAPNGGKVGKRKPKRKKDWEPSEEEIEEWMDMYSLPRKLAIVQIKSRRMDG